MTTTSSFNVRGSVVQEMDDHSSILYPKHIRNKKKLSLNITNKGSSKTNVEKVFYHKMDFTCNLTEVFFFFSVTFLGRTEKKASYIILSGWWIYSWACMSRQRTFIIYHFNWFSKSPSDDCSLGAQQTPQDFLVRSVYAERKQDPDRDWEHVYRLLPVSSFSSVKK